MSSVWAITLRWQLAVACIAIFVLPVAVAKQEGIATPAGRLIIRQMDSEVLGKEFEIKLGNQQVIRTQEGIGEVPFSDFPIPRLLKYVGKSIPPFDAVAVFQQFNWGNACNGGPIWFLGIHKNKMFSISEPIDFCGGPTPRVSVSSKAIYVALPTTKIQEATENSPNDKWMYRQGKIQPALSRRKK